MAAAEACLAPRTDAGVRLRLASGGLDPTALLFGEDASRALVTCRPEDLPRLLEAAGRAAVPATVVGKVTPGRFTVEVDGKTLMDLAVSGIREVWSRGLDPVVG